MFRQIFITILVCIFFMFAYLKYFELKGIYYPTREIHFTPAEAGFPCDDIFFETADGIILNGWFIPHEDPRATLLFCHGNAGNMSHRLEIIEILRQLNLNVFIFDYRGYGRSRGRPSEEGLYRDAQAAYNYLLKREDIDKEKIIVYGKSIGANVAIELVSRLPAKLLISESAFSSAYEMGKKLFPYLPIKWLISVKYDALSKIKNISIPKLIIHSQDDEIVPFAQGEKLFSAAAEPKEFYRMRGGHNEAVFLAKADYIQRIDNFLKQYLD